MENGSAAQRAEDGILQVTSDMHEMDYSLLYS